MTSPYYVSLPSRSPFANNEWAEAATIEIARTMAILGGGCVYDDTLCPVRVDRVNDDVGQAVAGVTQPGCAMWGTSMAGLQAPSKSIS